MNKHVKKQLEEIKEIIKTQGSAHAKVLNSDDVNWLIEQAEKVERYENAVNLAVMQLEESSSIPFALDALNEVHEG